MQLSLLQAGPSGAAPGLWPPASAAAVGEAGAVGAVGGAVMPEG